MGRYLASHQTAAGTNLTILHLGGAAAARPALNHMILGSDATPANLAGEFIVAATTVAPVGGTALTERVVDPAMSAAAITALGGTMTEATYGDVFLMIPLNQQATWQWWANPGWEPRTAVGTANGIGLRSVGHGGTPNVNATLGWEE